MNGRDEETVRARAASHMLRITGLNQLHSHTQAGSWTQSDAVTRMYKKGKHNTTQYGICTASHQMTGFCQGGCAQGLRQP